MFRPSALCALLLCTLFAFALAKQQEFRLHRPDAQSVGLVGEFNGWKSQPMARGKDGSWTITTEALQWFTAASSGGATPTPKSNFDSFFKKP